MEFKVRSSRFNPAPPLSTIARWPPAPRAARRSLSAPCHAAPLTRLRSYAAVAQAAPSRLRPKRAAPAWPRPSARRTARRPLPVRQKFAAKRRAFHSVVSGHRSRRSLAFFPLSYHPGRPHSSATPAQGQSTGPSLPATTARPALSIACTAPAPLRQSP